MDKSERLSRSVHARTKRSKIRKILEEKAEHLHGDLHRLREKKRKFHIKHPIKY